MARVPFTYLAEGVRFGDIIAVPNATVTFYEADGTTLLAQSLWNQASGGTAQPNPTTTGANGATATFWLDTPQTIVVKWSAAGWGAVTDPVSVGSGAGVVTSANVDSSIEVTSHKNVANGYAGLDSNGKVARAQVYPTYYNVASGSFGLALDGSTDDTAAWNAIINGNPPGVIYVPEGKTVLLADGIIDTNWQILGSGLNSLLKLPNGAAAGKHVIKTKDFSTLTQTVIANGGGSYGFGIRRILVDANKANNASGGHGIAIAGYDHCIDDVIVQNAKSANIWLEYPNSSEPIVGGVGSNRQRAARWGRVTLFNADCASVAAANTRNSEGRAALSTGQLTAYGPGDSFIEYLECVRNGSVAGTGLLMGAMDFTAGMFTEFDLTIGNYTAWLNHDVAIDIAGSGFHCAYIHAEGANVNVKIRAQTPHIIDGKVFAAQPSGTNLQVVSGCNFGRINVHMPSTGNAGVKYIDIASSTCTEAEIFARIELGNAVTATVTAGSLPTGAKLIDISADNYGGATVTAGWLPQVPVGGNFYRLFRSLSPIGVQGATTLHSGSGVPSNSLGSNGDYYFRTDTPGSANQRLYAKSAGAWSGIV